jgi:hypothetical protein
MREIGYGILVVALALPACGKKSSEVAATEPAASAAVASAAPPPEPTPAAASAAAAGDAAVAALAAAPAAAPAVVAIPAAAHPAYLHALTDLRIARHNLERKMEHGSAEPGTRWDERAAIDAVDRAMHEIKIAAIDDGKDLSDRQPPDTTTPRRGRLRRALASLRAARHDIITPETNPNVLSLRERATHHIDEAIRLTESGIATEDDADHEHRPLPPH